MIFWLKSFNTPGHTKYSVGQINTYPLGQNVVQIVSSQYLYDIHAVGLPANAVLLCSFGLGLVV